MHFNKRNSSASTVTSGLSLGLWCFFLVAVIVMAQQQPCEGRYLETRSNGDALDKLRELMWQILESSDNQGSGNTMPRQRSNWKYGGARDAYDNGRYY